MHIIRKILTIFIGLSTFSLSTVAIADDSYRLATDDVISVIVFNEPDLNAPEIKISDNGTISVPLLGQVKVQGKTIAEVEQVLHDMFGADYLRHPKVTVSVDEYRPFYINGEVDDPGSYPFKPDMTVEIAVTLAGGFTERASKSKIFLAKENETNNRKRVDLDYKVRPGDVITVEESFF
jgi:polysaccharide export outer membrane protein